MAISRTLNPFTCRRDLEELEMLILTRTDLMIWIRLARESRAVVRSLRQLGYTDEDACIKNTMENHRNNLRIVGKRLEEYRTRCKFAKMNINEATAFRNKLIEYINEN